jgi:hypothetical protein
MEIREAKAMTRFLPRMGSLLAGAALVVVGVAAAANPVAVKTSARNEIRPAAGSEWLVWSESRAGRSGTFDVWAQRENTAPVRVNPPGTQGYAGGIDGTNLVYQLVRARSSDLRIYDLARGTHRRLAPGFNTPAWEWHPTLSGDWMLFARGRPFARGAQMIVLRHLVTGEQRVLDRLRNRRGVLTPGQVQGSFAAWMRCNPHPRCRIVRYEIMTRATVALPVPAGKVVYGAAVDTSGTAYYARSGGGCGNGVELVKHPLGGAPEVLATLPRGEDLKFPFAVLAQAKPRPPLEPTIVRVYYDRIVCRRNTWDVYRVDDVARPPPLP